jgi:hypothetical protein
MIDNLTPVGETQQGHYYDCSLFDKSSETPDTYVCSGYNGVGAHALFCIHCKFRGQSHGIFFDFFCRQALTAKIQKAKPTVIPVKRGPQRELSRRITRSITLAESQPRKRSFVEIQRKHSFGGHLERGPPNWPNSRSLFTRQSV